ncbi:hypothetical protein JQR88_15590 [Pseudomonas luteola]|uniref:hypothetical protein n=1 Tax=Pseudomonas luteola TaxID=47886 RepID=UPI003DA17EF1
MAVDTDNTHAELPEHWQQGRHSLGWRLVVVTLGFCFFFTLITVGVRTWAVWHENVHQMDIELGLIEQVYQRTLTKAIWDMDQESVEAHLDSAVHIASVARVQLTVFFRSANADRSGALPDRMDRVKPGSDAPGSSGLFTVRRE